MKRILFVSFMAFLLAVNLSATDYHVAKTGSDQNDGSAESPLTGE